MNVINHFERQKLVHLTSVKSHFAWGPFDIRNKPLFSMRTRFEVCFGFFLKIIFMESSFIFKSLKDVWPAGPAAGGLKQTSIAFLVIYFILLLCLLLFVFVFTIDKCLKFECIIRQIYAFKNPSNIRHYFIVSEHICCWAPSVRPGSVGGLNASHWKSWSAPEITRACCAPLHPLPWIVLTAGWRANVKTSLFLNLTRKSVTRKQHDRRQPGSSALPPAWIQTEGTRAPGAIVTKDARE